MKPTRSLYQLTPDERAAWERLPPLENRAWDFWRSVAQARGLDYRTIVCANNHGYEFTALPLGHGKPWCWPAPIKCSLAAPVFTVAA